jgi:iron complex outermembrane receptor protein
VPLSALLMLCAGTGSAQTPPPADSAARETAVVLTPFEVLADRRDSYEATNTASLTGINTSLQRVPITADIYNRALLDDLGVTDLNRFLGDFAGYGSPVTGLNQFGRGNGDGDVTSADGLRARGLTVGSRRNGFTGAGVAAADSFSVERVEVIRGPQSLLYGPGDPGGVINYVSKAAVFGSNRGTLKGVFSSEGTYRAETDFNVARGDFAVRVGALNESVGFYRANLERRRGRALRESRYPSGDLHPPPPGRNRGFR